MIDCDFCHEKLSSLKRNFIRLANHGYHEFVACPKCVEKIFGEVLEEEKRILEEERKRK